MPNAKRIWPSSLRVLWLSSPIHFLFRSENALDNSVELMPLNVAMPQLEELRITGTNSFYSWKPQLFSAWLASFPASLTSLEIGYVPPALEPYISELPEACKIYRLYFSHSVTVSPHVTASVRELFGVPSVSMRLQHLSCFTGIETLELDGHSDLEWPSEHILPNLTSATFSRCRISRDTAIFLPKKLTRLHYIAHWDAEVIYDLLPASLRYLIIEDLQAPKTLAGSLQQLVHLEVGGGQAKSNPTGLQDLPDSLTFLSILNESSLSEINLPKLPNALTHLQASMELLEWETLRFLPSSLKTLILEDCPIILDANFGVFPPHLESISLSFADAPRSIDLLPTDELFLHLPKSLTQLYMSRPFLITGRHIPQDALEVDDHSLLESLLESSPKTFTRYARSRADCHELFPQKSLAIAGSVAQYAMWNLPRSVVSVNLKHLGISLEAAPFSALRRLSVSQVLTNLPANQILAKLCLPSLESLHIEHALSPLPSSQLAFLPTSLTELCLPNSEVAYAHAKKLTLPIGLQSVTVLSMDVKAMELFSSLQNLRFFRYIHASKLRASHIAALPRNITHFQMGHLPLCSTCQCTVSEAVTGAQFTGTIVPSGLLEALPKSVYSLDMPSVYGISTFQLSHQPNLRVVRCSFVLASLECLVLDDSLKTFSTPESLRELILATFSNLENLETDDWRLELADNDSELLPRSLTRVKLDRLSMQISRLSDQFVVNLPQTITSLLLPTSIGFTRQAIYDLPRTLLKLRIRMQGFKPHYFAVMPPALEYLHVEGPSGSYIDIDLRHLSHLSTLLIDDPKSVDVKFISKLPQSLRFLLVGNCTGLDVSELNDSLPPSLTRISLYGMAEIWTPSLEMRHLSFFVRKSAFSVCKDRGKGEHETQQEDNLSLYKIV